MGDDAAVEVRIAGKAVEVPAGFEVCAFLPVVPARQHDEVRIAPERIQDRGFERASAEPVLGDAGLPPRLAGAVEFRILHVGDLFAEFVPGGEDMGGGLLVQLPGAGLLAAAVMAGAVDHPGQLRDLPEAVDCAEDHPVDRSGGGFDLPEHRLELFRLHAPAVGLEIIDRFAVHAVKTGTRRIFFQETDDSLRHDFGVLRYRTFAECDFIHEKDREFLFRGDVENGPDHILGGFLDEFDSFAVVGMDHDRDRVQPGRFHAADLPADDVGIGRIVEPDQRIAVAVPVQPPGFAGGGQGRIHMGERPPGIRVRKPPPDMPLLDVGRFVFQDAEAFRPEFGSGCCGGEQECGGRVGGRGESGKQVHSDSSWVGANRCGMPGLPASS